MLNLSAPARTARARESTKKARINRGRGEILPGFGTYFSSLLKAYQIQKQNRNVQPNLYSPYFQQLNHVFHREGA
jgi:hypothetical protein